MVIYSEKVQLNISLLLYVDMHVPVMEHIIMCVQHSELFLDIINLVYFLLLHVAVLFNAIRNT